MSKSSTQETQYSIYKMSFEAIEKVFSSISHGESVSEYAENIISCLINSIKKILNDRKVSLCQDIKYQGFRGVIFKTTHHPAWEGIAKTILDGNEIKDKSTGIDSSFLTNTNISYVYFYKYSGIVYAVTGGYGSNYISKFVEKNYGLYLLPKLINKDNSVIKSIQQNNLLGNQTASQRTNKNSTSIETEQDMSSIFRQLSIEATKDIVENLGISFREDESEDKRINIVNKDSIVVRRSISLDELKALIERLYELEKTQDNFALNYLVLARKKRIKNAELFDEMLEVLVDGKYESFILTGDDYTTFFTGASKFCVTDSETKDIILEQETPITFLDIIEKLGDKKKHKNAIKHMLKEWDIYTEDNAGNCVLYPVSVFDALQGIIEFGEGKQPCYLFNGQWYVFDGRFSELLTKEFKSVYAQNQLDQERLLGLYGLCKDVSSEEAYNSALMKDGKIIVSHTALIENVEIADAIFFEDNTIYLMHNKDKFSGIGVRDVTNQVLTSAAFLQNKLSFANKSDFLHNYYSKILSIYNRKGLKLPEDEATFESHFQNQIKICYIIGYIKDYKEDSKSNYAKYLTVETVKKLEQRGFKCITLGVGSSN